MRGGRSGGETGLCGTTTGRKGRRVRWHAGLVRRQGGVKGWHTPRIHTRCGQEVRYTVGIHFSCGNGLKNIAGACFLFAVGFWSGLASGFCPKRVFLFGITLCGYSRGSNCRTTRAAVTSIGYVATTHTSPLDTIVQPSGFGTLVAFGSTLCRPEVTFAPSSA